MRRATPIRRSRATRRSPSACPARSPGLALAQQKYGSGKFTLAELIAPAIALARNGITVGDEIADSLPLGDRAAGALAVDREDFSEARRLAARAAATLLVQPDLADTLEAIAKQGPRAFYEGPIAEKIAAAVRAAGGVMTARRSEELSRGRARRCARQLSRLRHRLDAAAVVRRRAC